MIRDGKIAGTAPESDPPGLVPPFLLVIDRPRRAELSELKMFNTGVTRGQRRIPWALGIEQ